ncbi:MAG TPA: bifunctional riboflavin kinase/FAD synthetase [Legionella sp.]|nr:bifunctional riboflavin kinase/FAD synthetase [Legionella sp.]
MKLLRQGLQGIAPHAGSVATIGNFDGVHRGHQALLALLRKKADALNLPLLVILFEPQAGEYFKQEQAPARLYRLRDKLNALRQCGVDGVLCLKFDAQLSRLTAEAFAENIIFTQLKVQYLLLGGDFRFGCDRRGDVALLREWAAIRGVVVETYPEFCINHVRVSSTQIRHALYLGDLNLAESLLGRQYSLCGRVQHGQGMGRKWGVPTANLNLPRGALPLSGVFCVHVARVGKPLLMGVANMGNRPTVDGRKNVLEVHLFDFDESLYGEFIEISFVHKLRDEIKFSSVDDLLLQIHADVAAARVFFNV